MAHVEKGGFTAHAKGCAKGCALVNINKTATLGHACPEGAQLFKLIAHARYHAHNRRQPR